MTAAITDFAQYTTLRAAADNKDPAALREVANQFEALFLQTMLKSMRDASLAEPLFGDSDSLELYQDMMDKQLAVEMASGRGLGFADMIVRQLGGEEAGPPPVTSVGTSPHSSSRPTSNAVGALPGVVSERRTERSEAGMPEQAESDSTEAGMPRAIKRGDTPGSALTADKNFWSDAAEFAKDIWPHVKRVASALNVSPVGVLAQTALETGWGKHVMPDKNGQNSFNLFGIKAGNGWDGDAVSKPTLEFEAGVAKRETARFRSYDDVAATFDDYLDLLIDSPRYASVANHKGDVGGFAEALQRSGYATDPSYAEKIARIADSPLMKKVLSALKTEGSLPITNRLQTDAHRGEGW